MDINDQLADYETTIRRLSREVVEERNKRMFFLRRIFAVYALSIAVFVVIVAVLLLA